MLKQSQVARNVRVVFNDEWEQKCLGDKYLEEEPFLYIADGNIMNDGIGEYVYVRGASSLNSGWAYLNQLDLEFVSERDINLEKHIIDLFKEHKVLTVDEIEYHLTDVKRNRIDASIQVLRFLRNIEFIEKLECYKHISDR